MDYPSTFDKATIIVNMRPLPDDWEAQLEALRKETPKKFHDMFDDFFEIVVAANPIPPDGRSGTNRRP